MRVGDHLAAAMFVIVVLLITKFLLKNVGGGKYAHYTDDF